MRRMTTDFSCDHVADYNAFCVSVDEYDIKHLGPSMHLHLTKAYLSVERGVSS